MTAAHRDAAVARSARQFSDKIGRENRQLGARLFDQQFWLWGQDVSKLSTNGLVAYGFTRHAPPLSRRCSSCYRWMSEDERISLWGFGMAYSQPGRGGLFLRRYELGPELTDADELPPPCWGLEELPAYREPTAHSDWPTVLGLLDGLIGWIIRYENWLTEHSPADHRQISLNGWTRRCSTPESLQGDWMQLRSSIRAYQTREPGNAGA